MKNMTIHAREDRRSRLEYIVDTIGIGEIIATAENKDYRGGYCKLTSTGVVIVFSKDNKTVVTAFIADVTQAASIYKADKKVRCMPDSLYRRIKGNNYYRIHQPKDNSLT